MGQSDRQARIAQIRAQIEALQQELARLEREDADPPYTQYAERARAAGQAVLPTAEFQRYVQAYDQLEKEWVRLGRPQTGWVRMSVFQRLRALLLLPPLEGLDAAVSAPAPAPAAAAPPATRGRTAGPAASAAPARVAVPTVPREQLIEMHSPILNEVVELTKRAAEEFRLAKIADGLISAERAMYLLDRVAHAPAAMPNQLGKVVDEAAKASGIAEADRARMAAIRERASKIAAESAAHP